jgi:hypothetical protein
MFSISTFTFDGMQKSKAFWISRADNYTNKALKLIIRKTFKKIL